MKIKILTSAGHDLMDAYQFYEIQSKGLGTYFLKTLLADIDSLKINAGIHQLYFSKYHRLLSKRFPFAVYYKVQNKTVLIYAVLDCRMNPSSIQKKLS